MDLTEKLKNVPRGTRLRSPIFENPVILHAVNPLLRYPIEIKTITGDSVLFSKEGYYAVTTAPQNCMLFPTLEMTWEGYEYIPDGKLVVCEEDGKIIQIGCAKGGFARDAINVYWWYSLESHTLTVDALFHFDRQPKEHEYTDICNLLRKDGYEMIGTGLKKVCKFKKGDIIVNRIGIIAIFDHTNSDTAVIYKAIFYPNGKIKAKTDIGIGYIHECRLATTEEKNLFFNSLAEAGYYWDGDEVVPLFKKGDIVASERTISIIDHIADLGTQKNVIYYQCCIDCLGKFKMGVDCGVGTVEGKHLAHLTEKQKILKMLDEAGYEFDGVNVKPKQITFKPFDPVIVRDSSDQIWCGDFFQYMEGNVFVCTGSRGHFCLPYNDDTKHLVGTTMPAPKQYTN